MTNPTDYAWATQLPGVQRQRPDRAEKPPLQSMLYYALDGWQVFWAALGGALLMIPTLGVHRFWMITRLRRMIWNGVSVDGEPLEYTGRPLELLFGFLAAIVVLAAVLGAANLALVFAGLVGGLDLTLAFNASLPLLIPLGYYAQYRARRYLAARTRWRGIRFGMEPGAVTYALHATGHLILTILTLGLLYPRMHVHLAARRHEATWYGQTRFRQSARWTSFMGAWLVAWIPLAGLVVLTTGPLLANASDVLMEILQSGDDAAPALDPEQLQALGGWIIAAVSGLAGASLLAWPLLRRFGAASERKLMEGLSLGPVQFASTLRTGTLLRVDVRNVFMLSITLGIAAVVGWVLTLLILGSLSSLDLRVIAGNQVGALVAVAVPYVMAAAFYIAASWVTSIHWPLEARLDALSLSGVDRLSDVRQREDDAAREGGGFADALDVGAGF